MTKIEAILSRLPKFYNRDESGQLYNLLKSISDEFDVAQVDFIDRADNAIGVDKCEGQDLDWRFGSFLSIIRQPGEKDSTYRKRLQSATNALHGGTADSVKYSVAIFLGLADNEEKADRCIQIYDGWKYPNAEIEMKAYGHLVCVFKLDPEDQDLYYTGIEDDIEKQINFTKAAGVIAHVIVELTRYSVVGKYRHNELTGLTHRQIREWGIS